MSQIPLTPKELQVLQFIRRYWDRHGFAPTYIEIQKQFSYKAVSSVQQFLQQLVKKGYLSAPLGESKKRALMPHDAEELGTIIKLPLEGVVAAGKLTEAVHNREQFEVPRSLVSGDVHKNFALRVRGDSMLEDCILDGDVVIIKRQSEARNGQTVVALVEGEATIKRFYKRKNHIELHPANPNFDIITVGPNKDFKILGVLAGVVRNMN